MENRPRYVWIPILIAAALIAAPVFSFAGGQETTTKQEKTKKNGKAQEQPVAPANQEKSETPATQEQETTPAGGPMDRLRERITGVSASSVEILSHGSIVTEGDWTLVEENAEIRIGSDRTLLADKILFNLAENLIRAEGNVVLLENRLRIGGDSLEMNLNDNSAVLVNPYIENEEGFYISGTKLEKVGPDEYTLHGARLTTCNQPTPQWQMEASSISLKAGESATMRNLRFTLLDTLPVFYTPWIRLPLDRTRGTGFMLPEWGNSDFHGFWISNRFFWAIDESHDTTLGLDYYEKRGNRYSLEYRNNLGDGNVTNAYFYYIDDETFPRVRYDSRIVNRTKLPFGFETYTDLQFLSDNTYRRDFINRDVYFSPIFRKTMSLSNNFDGYSFLLSWTDTDRFLTRNKIDQLRILPRVDFRTRERQFFETPLYYSYSLNFVRPHLRDITRRVEQGKEDLIVDDAYNRLDLIGTVKLPVKVFAPWLTVTPYILGRNTEYSSKYNPKRDRIVEKPITRNYFDAGFDMTGPVFSKIYGTPGENKTIFKHVIQPEAHYLYRSDIEQKTLDQIIVIDQEDNFFRVHELKWGLSNVVYSKNFGRMGDPGRVVEVFRLGVYQYVSMEEGLLTSYDKKYVFQPSEVTDAPRFSPLLINASARISDYVNANGTLEFDADSQEMINYTLSGGFRFRSLNYNIGWYRTVGVVRFDRVGVFRSNSNRLVMSGNIGFFDGTLNFRGAYDYDFERERILNYVAGVDLRGQCLGAGFEIRKLNVFGQNDLQTRFSITIGGLGAILGGGDR